MFVSESELQNRAFFVIITFSGSDKKGYHHKPLATYILIFFKIINAENRGFGVLGFWGFGVLRSEERRVGKECFRLCCCGGWAGE